MHTKHATRYGTLPLMRPNAQPCQVHRVNVGSWNAFQEASQIWRLALLRCGPSSPKTSRGGCARRSSAPLIVRIVRNVWQSVSQTSCVGCPWRFPGHVSIISLRLSPALTTPSKAQKRRSARTSHRYEFRVLQHCTKPASRTRAPPLQKEKGAYVPGGGQQCNARIGSWGTLLFVPVARPYASSHRSRK